MKEGRKEGRKGEKGAKEARDEGEKKLKEETSKIREESKKIKAQDLFLSNKSSEELREALKGVEIISSFNKDQLVELVKSNKEAKRKIVMKERKQELTSMTIQELKQILKNRKNISRLKKSELINSILTIEMEDNNNLP